MNYLIKRIFTSLLLLCIIYLSIRNSFFLFSFLIVLNFLSISEFNRIYKIIFIKKNFYIFLSTSISILYLTTFSLIIWIYLNSTSYIEIISIIFLLLICILTDTGGFVFGKLIGGKKLTKISPNKTYSGVLGSFLFSLIFGYLFFYYQQEFLELNINVLLFIIIVSFISQIGDLMISFFKRKAKIKDTGTILPGHGGILDRIDGILLGIPFGVLLISI